MEKRLQQDGIVRDEKAVALTECAIVMPILLLFFLATLQYFEFVRAAQMVNYATYVAARSYAVLHSQNYAVDAAALALAPISKNPPLPITGSVSGSDIVGLEGLISSMALLAQAPYGIKNYPFNTAMRIISASQSLQGNFAVTTNAISGNSLTQVNVSLNYPQVVNIPGLAGLWNYLAGNNPLQNFTVQTLPLAKGLASEDNVYFLLNSISIYGCVNIPSKCSTGYEAWGNTDTYNSDNKYTGHVNTVYTGWWPGSSGSWQPRSAAKP